MCMRISKLHHKHKYFHFSLRGVCDLELVAIGFLVALNYLAQSCHIKAHHQTGTKLNENKIEMEVTLYVFPKYVQVTNYMGTLTTNPKKRITKDNINTIKLCASTSPNVTLVPVPT